MSKQSEAKKKQKYNPKPVPRVCGNCDNYLSDIVQHKGVFCGTYFDEKNKRCFIGEFAVKKSGTCDLFRLKKVDNA